MSQLDENIKACLKLVDYRYSWLVVGSNPAEVRVMIFFSPGVVKLGRTSSMNIEYTRGAIFPQSLHFYILNIVVWKEPA